MASATDYLESAILNHLLNNSAMTSPTTVYAALFSVAGDDTAGSETELSGSGYARQAISFGAPNATTGVCSNDTAVTFSAAGGAWSEALAFGIFDASTAGNKLFHGALDASRTAGDGDDLTFAIGALSVTLA